MPPPYNDLPEKLFQLRKNMAFRRLTNAELEPLQPEFIQFLALQGITPDWWENWKMTDPLRVEALIQEFSQGIWQGLLQKVKYLEFHTPQDIKTFYCGEDHIELLGIRLEGDPTLEFSGPEDPATKLARLKAAGAQLQLYHATKSYQNQDRNQELYRLLEGGASISPDGALYQALATLRTSPD